jgi:hypothetical protein
MTQHDLQEGFSQEYKTCDSSFALLSGGEDFPSESADGRLGRFGG